MVDKDFVNCTLMPFVNQLIFMIVLSGKVSGSAVLREDAKVELNRCAVRIKKSAWLRF